MAVAYQQAVGGASFVIRFQLQGGDRDVFGSWIAQEVLLIEMLDVISFPLMPIVFCLGLFGTLEVIKDIPDDAEVIFLGHIVFDLLTLRDPKVCAVLILIG